MPPPALPTLFASACLAVAAIGAATAASERTAPPGVLRLQRAAVIDGAGQDRPMVAGTLFVPHGWKVQGGVVWGPEHACVDYFNVEWSATAPDGSAAIGLLPQGGWEMNSTGNPTPLKPGCPMADIRDARTFAQRVVATRFAGARVLEYRPLPAESSQQPRQLPPGFQGQARMESGQVLFTFSRDGREMRGVATVGVLFEQTAMQTPGVGVLHFLHGRAQPTFVAIAPAAQFDFAAMEAARRSYVPDPAWMRVIAGHQGRLGQIALDGIRQRQQIWTRTQADIGQLITSSWNAQQQSADARAASFSRALRGVENWRDESGRTVELAGGQASAWRLDDGSYVMSTRAGFDPWRDLGLRGQKLEGER